MNILDGDECNRKIKLSPKVEHGQIFIGSLFELTENMKGKKCFNQEVSILHVLAGEGEKITLLFWAFGA